MEINTQIILSILVIVFGVFIDIKITYFFHFLLPLLLLPIVLLLLIFLISHEIKQFLEKKTKIQSNNLKQH